MQYSLALSGESIPSNILDKFKSIGMIRGEYLCRYSGEWILSKKCQFIIKNYIEEKLKKTNKSIWYRLIDMESNEVNTLADCDNIIKEKTTMLGLRGVRRGMVYPDALIEELKLISTISWNNSNLNLLIPFVCDACEISYVIEILKLNGFRGKVGVMLETPAAILDIDTILKTGVDHLVVGMNDLTSLTLGMTRNNIFFNYHHNSIINLLKFALKHAEKNNISISIAGYLNLSDINMLEKIGFEEIIIHYSLLPKVWPELYADLPNVIDFKKIKNDIRDKVNDPRI